MIRMTGSDCYHIQLGVFQQFIQRGIFRLIFQFVGTKGIQTLWIIVCSGNDFKKVRERCDFAQMTSPDSTQSDTPTFNIFPIIQLLELISKVLAHFVIVFRIKLFLTHRQFFFRKKTRYFMFYGATLLLLLYLVVPGKTILPRGRW